MKKAMDQEKDDRTIFEYVSSRHLEGFECPDLITIDEVFLYAFKKSKSREGCLIVLNKLVARGYLAHYKYVNYSFRITSEGHMYKIKLRVC